MNLLGASPSQLIWAYCQGRWRPWALTALGMAGSYWIWRRAGR